MMCTVRYGQKAWMCANLILSDPIQPLHVQISHEPVVPLALPGLMVMASTSPMILCVRSLRTRMINNSEDRLDLVGSGLLKLAWSD